MILNIYKNWFSIFYVKKCYINEQIMIFKIFIAWNLILKLLNLPDGPKWNRNASPALVLVVAYDHAYSDID